MTLSQQNVLVYITIFGGKFGFRISHGKAFWRGNAYFNFSKKKKTETVYTERSETGKWLSMWVSFPVCIYWAETKSMETGCLLFFFSVDIWWSKHFILLKKHIRIETPQADISIKLTLCNCATESQLKFTAYVSFC